MNESRDLWELVLVALASGSIGSFLTVLFRGRYERKEALRVQRLSAIEQFATETQRAWRALQRAKTEDAAREELGTLVASALERTSLVRILFGRNTAVDVACKMLMNAFVYARRDASRGASAAILTIHGDAIAKSLALFDDTVHDELVGWSVLRRLRSRRGRRRAEKRADAIADAVAPQLGMRTRKQLEGQE